MNLLIIRGSFLPSFWSEAKIILSDSNSEKLIDKMKSLLEEDIGFHDPENIELISSLILQGQKFDLDLDVGLRISYIKLGIFATEAVKGSFPNIL